MIVGKMRYKRTLICFVSSCRKIIKLAEGYATFYLCIYETSHNHTDIHEITSEARPRQVGSAWSSPIRTVTELQLKPESSYSIIQVPSGWCGRVEHRSITASQGEIYSCGGAEEAPAQKRSPPTDCVSIALPKLSLVFT